MPSQPAWFHRLPEILDVLRGKRRIGFHDLKAFIKRFQFCCNVDWSTWYPFSMTEDPRPLTQGPPF